MGKVRIVNRLLKAIINDDIFDGRRIIKRHDLGIEYYRIAKVATISIRRAINRTPKKDTIQEEIFKFSFVRNPFDRLVSCYTDKCKDIGCVTSQGQRVRYFDYYYINGLFPKGISFEDFVKRACRIPKRMMDRHFCPQYLFLYKRNGQCLVDYIGHLETMEQDYQVIKDRFGLADLKHVHASKRRDWKEYYTKETAQLVYRTYKKDFELFGYEQKYQELMDYLDKKENEKNHPHQ